MLEASLNSGWVREEIDRWAERQRSLTPGDDGPGSIVVPVDLDGYLWTSEHPYAPTIRKFKVIDAQGWATDHEVRAKAHRAVERALRRQQSPFDHLKARNDNSD